MFAVLSTIVQYLLLSLFPLSSLDIMVIGGKNPPNVVLDEDVGYSPSCEDLSELVTEYVNPECLDDLSEMNLNIMHINIHGILNKQDSLSRLITSLGGRNKVNVVSLNETWLSKKTEQKVNIPGYNYVGKYRTGKKGGGVGFLISEDLRYRELSSPLAKLKALESFSIELKTKSKSVILVSLYRPLNQQIQTSLQELSILFANLQKLNKPVVICTDHNIDLIKASSHSKTQ